MQLVACGRHRKSDACKSATRLTRVRSTSGSVGKAWAADPPKTWTAGSGDNDELAPRGDRAAGALRPSNLHRSGRSATAAKSAPPCSTARPFGHRQKVHAYLSTVPAPADGNGRACQLCACAHARARSRACTVAAPSSSPAWLLVELTDADRSQIDHIRTDPLAWHCACAPGARVPACG